MKKFWHSEIAPGGWIVKFEHENGIASFRPDGFGKVRAVSLAPGLQIDFQAIYRCAMAARGNFPEKRFGHRASAARGVLCDNICAALNAAGIRPTA